MAQAFELAESLGRPFTDEEVRDNKELWSAADRWIQNQTGPLGSSFLESVRDQSRRYHGITYKQARGVLNAMVAQWRKMLAEGEESNEPAATYFNRPGTYTVIFDDTNPSDYVTLKIKDVIRGNLAGKRIISYLSGPDNETSFTGLGFIDDKGFRIWRKHEGTHVRQVEAINLLMSYGAEEIADAAFQYAAISGRCSNCGKTLTVPTSLYRGYGPDCWERLKGKM